MGRVIEIDDDLFEELQQRAVPLVDDINSVLRRVLTGPSDGQRAPGKSSSGPARRSGRRSRAKVGSARAARGTLLPEAEYELPILEALHQAGGRLPASEVIERVGNVLRDRFKAADLDKLRSGDVRWRNRVQFTRLRLSERGDIRKDSPRGTWEITEQGTKRVLPSKRDGKKK